MKGMNRFGDRTARNHKSGSTWWFWSSDRVKLESNKHIFNVLKRDILITALIPFVGKSNIKFVTYFIPVWCLCSRWMRLCSFPGPTGESQHTNGRKSVKTAGNIALPCGARYSDLIGGCFWSLWLQETGQGCLWWEWLSLKKKDFFL